MTLELRVNGTPRHVDADESTSLLVVMREHLGLTGCKPGCGEGECGACTVLLDGKAMRSCITEARQAEAIISEEKADVVLLARQFLRDPYFPLHAAQELGVDVNWPDQYLRAK